jgi:hypothetical protein
MVSPGVLEQVEILVVMHPEMCDLARTSGQGDTWRCLIDDFAFRIEKVVNAIELAPDKSCSVHVGRTVWEGAWIIVAQTWRRELLELTASQLFPVGCMRSGLNDPRSV